MSEDLLLFLGRFHPLLAHLPIGIIVLLVVLELLARSRRFASAACNTGYILAFGVPASILTAALGWLLSRPGDYNAALLKWHFWTGFATAALLGLAALLYWAGTKKGYRVVLAVTFVSLLVASHFGGSLTHGSDYLVEYAPAPVKQLFGSKPSKPQPEANPVFYEATIQPVLNEYCAGCHGPEKAKGDLRVHEYEFLLNGGDTGPAVIPGQSAASLLIKRMRLPIEDEDHMPPEGKPQPSDEEIALVAWWIDSGASATNRLNDLKLPASLAAMLSKGAAPAGPATPPLDKETIVPVVSELARTWGASITPLSETEPWLQVNASILGTNFTDQSLSALAKLNANIRWLDVSGTAITDASAPVLSAMPNLERLQLQRTAITDASLNALSSLHQLTYLNLYGTQVTDAGLNALAQLPNLRQLYLWQTKVTPAAATNFAEARIDRAQIRQWETEIAALQQKIRAEKVIINIGIESKSAVMALNTTCPVSGKPVDSAKIAVHEGSTIAFCCDDCKNAFLKDPANYASKLTPIAQKPINAECIVSGKAIDSAHTTTYEGTLIGFCCSDCREKFLADPKSFADKLVKSE